MMLSQNTPCPELAELTAFANGHLTDAKTVLSAISVAKYSRYYWFWNELSKGDPASAGKKPWWKADIEGLLLGGIVQGICDSIVAYLDK